MSILHKVQIRACTYLWKYTTIHPLILIYIVVLNSSNKEEEEEEEEVVYRFEREGESWILVYSI